MRRLNITYLNLLRRKVILVNLAELVPLSDGFMA